MINTSSTGRVHLIKGGLLISLGCPTALKDVEFVDRAPTDVT